MRRLFAGIDLGCDAARLLLSPEGREREGAAGLVAGKKWRADLVGERDKVAQGVEGGVVSAGRLAPEGDDMKAFKFIIPFAKRSDSFQARLGDGFAKAPRSKRQIKITS